MLVFCLARSTTGDGLLVARLNGEMRLFECLSMCTTPTLDSDCVGDPRVSITDE